MAMVGRFMVVRIEGVVFDQKSQKTQVITFFLAVLLIMRQQFRQTSCLFHTHPGNQTSQKKYNRHKDRQYPFQTS